MNYHNLYKSIFGTDYSYWGEYLPLGGNLFLTIDNLIYCAAQICIIIKGLTLPAHSDLLWPTIDL